LRRGKLVALTRDHSVVQTLIDTGEITARAAKTHPKRHTLTQHLGGRGGADMLEQGRAAELSAAKVADLTDDRRVFERLLEALDGAARRREQLRAARA
jgi:serine/threonine protein phosphatase PrpC